MSTIDSTPQSDDSGKSNFAYDDMGRLASQVHAIGNGATAKWFALSYEHGSSGGATGHIVSITYPSGNRISVAYGADGKANGLTLTPPNAAPTTIMSDIRYSALGTVQGWTWGRPDSKNTYQREFDMEGRIKRYPLGPVNGGSALRTLTYDAVGRIKSMTHSGSSTAQRLDQIYWYDDQGRLNRVEGPNLSQAYDYDANGNRIRSRFGAGAYTNMISSTSNQIAKSSGPTPAKSYVYDAAGNLTSDGSTRYTYGTNGRLAAVNSAAGTTRYKIDGFGQRVLKESTSGRLTYYVHDIEGRLIGEYDRFGQVKQETIYLDDLPVAVIMQSRISADQPLITNLYRVFTDHLRTPRVITRASDNRVVWRWDNADPFGLEPPDERPSGLPKFIYNPRFPGQVYDSETNTHYNYFRDYDPLSGRYVQSDPIGLLGGLNTYSYAEGNPNSFIDPTGEFIQVAIGAGTSVASGWLISQFTGQCYGPKDVLADALLGAGGVGLFNKMRTLHRVSKLRSIAAERGMVKASAQLGVEMYTGIGTSVEIKWVGNILSPGGKLNHRGSWFPRARYKVAQGDPRGIPRTYFDPFSGKTGPLKSAAAHIPLQATIGESGVLGSGIGATINNSCGCD